MNALHYRATEISLAVRFLNKVGCSLESCTDY